MTNTDEPVARLGINVVATSDPMGEERGRKEEKQQNSVLLLAQRLG